MGRPGRKGRRIMLCHEQQTCILIMQASLADLRGVLLNYVFGFFARIFRCQCLLPNLNCLLAIYMFLHGFLESPLFVCCGTSSLATMVQVVALAWLRFSCHRVSESLRE